MLIKWLKLTKGHNSGKKQSSVTLVLYNPFQVRGTNNNWKVSLKSTENCKRSCRDKTTVEKLLKGHNSGKNQLSMTSIKYLQVMETITGKFHQNPSKTVG